MVYRAILYLHLMGFALWIDAGIARCAGAHEYRPMGVAVVAETDLFRARDFNPRVRPPARDIESFRGLFASLNDVNRYLAGTRDGRTRGSDRRALGPRRPSSLSVL